MVRGVSSQARPRRNRLDEVRVIVGCERRKRRVKAMTMQKMKVVMFAAAVLFVQFADALTFTADSTEIAIPTNAVGPVRLAAKEMKEFLSRVFGAPVPIVNRVSPAKSTIILGTNGWSKAVGIDISTLRCDGYLHKTLGNALYIAGADSDLTIDHCVTSRFFDRGTLMGTYAFLEKYAGCRFYFPGELGEVVPQRDAITIPENLGVELYLDGKVMDQLHDKNKNSEEVSDKEALVELSEDDVLDEIMEMAAELTRIKISECREIAKAAGYSIERVKKAHEAAKQQKEFKSSYTAFMIWAIKDDISPNTKTSKKSAKGGFDDFEQREYDYDELEKDALKMNGTEGVYPLFTIIDQD